MKKLIVIICLLLLIIVNINNIVDFIIDYYNIIIEDMNDDIDKTINSLYLEDESED